MERAGLIAIDDAGSLARRHPDVARHLRDARDRLAGGDLDDAAVIAIGGALRAPLAGMAEDLVGNEVNPERVARGLGAWLTKGETAGRVPPRQAEAITSLVDLTSKCCQRLDHLRDERSRGEPDNMHLTHRGCSHDLTDPLSCGSSASTPRRSRGQCFNDV